MEKYSIIDIGLKAVRDSGKANMFDRKSVQYYLFHMGFCEAVSLLEEEPMSYVTILNSVDMDNSPSVDWEYLLDLDDMGEARSEIIDQFAFEIARYRDSAADMRPLPFDWDDTLMGDIIHSVIQDHPDTHHILSHVFTSEALTYVWFKNGWYMWKHGVRQSEWKKVTMTHVDITRKAISGRKYGEWSKLRFKAIEDMFRLRELLS